MVAVVKKGASKLEIKEALKVLKKNKVKGFDAHKFSGTIKFKEDGLMLQKQWRNEW